MKRFFLKLTLAALVCCTLAGPASAAGLLFNRGYWHGNYYEPDWAGQPHALVVPPTVHRQINYGWGASGTELSRIPFQYRVGGRADGTFPGGVFAPAPVQPSHTKQMGVYYIRAPWK